MIGAGSADLDARPGWRWDVALSFAGAQRDYVEQVANVLKAEGVRCFYDADEQIDLWGKYLAEELPLIYGEQAAAVVVFVSAEYAARDWTQLERRAALNKAVRERREYVLPARFDDTPLPGLLSDMVAIDLRTRTPRQFAAMIAAKLAALGIIMPIPPEHVPQDIDVAEFGVPSRDQMPISLLPTPWQLPRDVAYFTGRVAELAMLDSLLPQGDDHPGAAMFPMIIGTAGVGKTALAVHWAHRVRRRFPVCKHAGL
jgi:TIR domain